MPGAADQCGPFAYCLGFLPADNIGGWTAVGKGGVASTVMILTNNYTEPDDADGSTLHFNAEDGTQSLDLTGEGNQGDTNGVKQTIATAPGTVYQITFYLGHQYDLAPGYAGPSSLSLWLDLAGTGANEVGVFTNGDDTVDDVTWNAFTYDFEALGDATTIAFLNATPIGNNFAGLDGVSVVQAPEPSSVLLTAAGLLTLVCVRGRKVRAARL